MFYKVEKQLLEAYKQYTFGKPLKELDLPEDLKSQLQRFIMLQSLPTREIAKKFPEWDYQFCTLMHKQGCTWRSAFKTYMCSRSRKPVTNRNGIAEMKDSIDAALHKELLKMIELRLSQRRSETWFRKQDFNQRNITQIRKFIKLQAEGKLTVVPLQNCFKISRQQSREIVQLVEKYNETDKIKI